MSIFNRNTGAPPSAGTPEGLAAVGVYIDLVSGLKAHVRSLRQINLFLMAVAAVLSIGLVVLLPLKERIPYFYEVDSSSGSVALSNRVVEKLSITDSTVAYFLRVWVARLVTINASTLKEGLPAAYRWTRGSAQTELDTWTETVDQTAKRLGEKPGLTREILGQPTVSFNESKTVAFVDLVWVEKVKGVETERKRKLISIEFGVTSAAAEKPTKVDDDNPIGLLITHFTINEQKTTP